MTLERKNHQPESFVPESLLVICANDPPVLTRRSEAARSRMHVVRMPYTFRPANRYDATDPSQRLQNPRLKDDPEYFREELAPAFFSWLLQGFQDAVGPWH